MFQVSKTLICIKTIVMNELINEGMDAVSSFPPVSNKERLTGTVSVRAACHRSMQKNEKPHSLSVGYVQGWVC